MAKLTIQLDNPKPSVPVSISYQPDTAIPVHRPLSATSVARPQTTLAASSVGSAPVVKSKFQDLDAFLDSETEEDTESEEE